MGTRAMIEGQRGGVGGDVVLARAEEHLEAVTGAGVDVVLDEPQAGTHLEQLLLGDAGAVVIRPVGYERGGVELDLPVAHQQPNQRMGDAFGH